MRRHAGAAIGATHELDRLRGRQKRRLAVSLALLKLLADLDDVVVLLREQPLTA
jgi:hypothetical protein